MPKHLSRYSVRLVFLFAVVSATLPLAGQTSREEMLAHSSIIFTGKVAKLAAVSLPVIRAAENTVVVTVESVLVKPAALSLKPGDIITVEVKDASKFGIGTRATFFTIGVIFGEGLAVQELGSEIQKEQAASADNMQAARAMQEEKENAELRKRMQGAELIFAGKVISVHPDPIASPDNRAFSEHDPMWQDAVVLIQSAVKGVTAGQQIVLRFPASLDIMWSGYPKLKEGQEAIFLLQPDRISGKPIAVLNDKQVPAYIAPTARHVLKKEEEKHL